MAPRRLGVAAVCLTVAMTGCGPGAGGDRRRAPPSTAAPATDRRVFFDPQDLSTPDVRAVLAGPADRSRFAAWLRARAHASDRLVSALGQARSGEVLVVIARTVGCDSVGRVELRRDGAALALLPHAVRHYPECVRANHLVAVFALPRTALPPRVTVDGSPPDTGWR